MTPAPHGSKAHTERQTPFRSVPFLAKYSPYKSASKGATITNDYPERNGTMRGRHPRAATLRFTAWNMNRATISTAYISRHSAMKKTIALGLCAFEPNATATT